MASAEHTIDINCDMGESYGDVIVGNDDSIFPHITSCNIACGFHGGDPMHMEHTIKAALTYCVRIGAHPSYPDRENFGRKRMTIPADELKALLRYQITALIGMTKALGGSVTYVKPHGALYNTAADNASEANVIVEAISTVDPHLALMGLPDSAMQEAANLYGIAFIAEAFADRRYHNNGRLVSRQVEGSVIEDPQIAAQQVLSIVLKREVSSIEGEVIPVVAQSICVHGDHQNTPEVVRAIDEALRVNGIRKAALEHYQI